MISILLANILFLQAGAQARLVLNGGVINLHGGAYLVIDNPSANALVRNSGGIISEGTTNRIKWNIGTATGTYIIPWLYDTEYLPLSFTKSGGAGSGYFLFSTYHTGWENSAELPPGISNFNRASGADNSAFAVDRFWQINAQDYTTKPTLTDLTFTYAEIEHTEPPNAINENVLVSQRWNEDAESWTDFAAGTVNIANNTVTVPEVQPEDLYAWWDLTYIAERHWIAGESSSWSADGNWSTAAGGPPNAVMPTAADDVYFDDVIDDDCIIDTDAVMNNLAIDADYSGVIIQGANAITVGNSATFGGGTFVGGTAVISVGGAFNLSGNTFTSTAGILDLDGDFNFTGGTFAHHNGTVRFSGENGITQNIGGTLPATFNNLAVTNVSVVPGAALASNQNLRGVLTMASDAVFDADGTDDASVFTLLSTNDNPTRDAAIGILPIGALISGNVRIQRYMALEGADNARIYRYIASPLQNGSVVDIQGEIPVTGSFTGASVCQGCITYSPSMFTYTESSTGDTNGDNQATMDDGFVDFPETDNKEILLPGKGYTLYVRGSILTSALWDVTGIVTQGNTTAVSLPVGYTSSGVAGNDGWNLVGNPYASTIDWNAATGWTKANLDAAIYIRDNGVALPRFATWNGVTGTNGGSRYIALGQAFWVKANGGGTPELTATENVKAPGVQTTFFREITTDNLLRVALVKGSVRDEAVIHFRPDATAGFDTHADTWKMKSASFDLSVLAGEHKLSINSLPEQSCLESVNLMIEQATAGNYQLDFSSMDSFIRPTTIMLTDRFTGDTTDVGLTGAYHFSVTPDAASQGANRFSIQFKSPLDSVAIEQHGNVLMSSYAAGNQWYLDGQLIPGATTQNLPVTQPGTYSVIVTAGGCTTTASRVLSITGTAETTDSKIRITPNPVLHELYIEIPGTVTGAREATLINSLGQTLQTIPLQQEAGKRTGKMVMSDYPTGTYIVRIIGSAGRTDTKIFKQ